jgi:hypothetical protein
LLLAVFYACLPGLFVLHTAVAHSEQQQAADVTAEVCHHDGHHHHDGQDGGPEPGEPELPCQTCQIVGSLGVAGAVPTGAMAWVAYDVASPEVVFRAEVVHLPLDVRAAPASPRAPPVV